MSTHHLFTPKAVLFDFDGTLAHLTLDFSRMKMLVVQKLKQEFELEPNEDEARLPVMELIGSLCRRSGSELASVIRQTAESCVEDYEVECADSSGTLPYTRDLLGRLRNRNVVSAIVTRNCRKAVERVFPDHADYCACLLSRNDVSRIKPDPEHLHAALRIMGIPAPQALMVGDHPLDIKAGHNAGCKSGGVLTGDISRNVMESSRPDFLAENADALMKLLGL